MDEKYLNLKEAINDGDDEAALEEADVLLEAGTNPLQIFTECVEPTLNEMGEQFAKLEIYLPDLVMAGDCVTALQEKLTPIMQEQNLEEISKGKEQRIVERIVKAVVDMFKDTKKGARK